MIRRELMNRIINTCFKGKVIMLMGARQVGKTTLLREITKELKVSFSWLNADEGDIRSAFNRAETSTELLQLIGKNNELVIIDEAQQIQDIGLKLKLLHDTYPDIQLIATGSSAFELQNETSEALTGRKRTLHLYPFSFREIANHKSLIESKRLINSRLIYGSYPEILNNPGNEKEALIEIAQSYLYKDLLQVENIRKPAHIEKLLTALALQVGSEVNYHELAQTVGNINTATVEKYLDLFEKAYIIFKLPAFNRNLRNEIKKGKKYYFYDNGIRNVLINDFKQPDLRLDKGALWENYLLSERIKINSYSQNHVNMYFWRTHDQAEIDYIEEQEGILHAYELKWKNKKVNFPKSFLKAYPNHTTKVINWDSYVDFIM